MRQIITSQQSASNYHPSIQKVDFSNSTRLPLYKFRQLKRDHHQVCAESVLGAEHKPTTKLIYQTIINNCDKEGSSRIAHLTIAKKLCISRSTVIRHCKRLEADGHIITYKNGWQESNTTIVTAIQHWNINKCVNMEHNHTPGEEPPKNGSSPPGKNEEKEVAYTLADASDAPKEAEWDDHIPFKPDTEEEIAYKTSKMRELKEMFGLKHRKH